MYLFNGSGNYITFPAPTYLPQGDSSRTVSYWIRPKTRTTDAWVFYYGDISSNNAFGVTFLAATSGQKISVWGHTHDVQGSITLNDGQLYHVVCTYDSATSTLKTYINNVVDINTTTTDYATGDGEFRLGNASFETTYYYPGGLYGLKVFDRALSSTEVSTLYGGGSVSSGLVFSAYCDEPYGTSCIDSVGGNNGTIYGVTTNFFIPISVLLQDSFTDTDNVLLKNHAPDVNNTGDVWHDANDNWKISSNQLVKNGGDVYTTTINLGVNTFKWTGKLYVTDGDYDASIHFRRSGGDGLFFQFHSLNYIWLRTLVGYSYNTTLVTTSWTKTTGWKYFTLTVTPTHIKLEFDGLTIDYDSTLYNTQQTIGLANWTGCSPKWESFLVETSLPSKIFPQSFKFNSSYAEYLNCGTHAEYNIYNTDATFSFWRKSSDVTSLVVVMLRGWYGVGGFYIQQYPSNEWEIIHNTSGAVRTSGAMAGTENQWHHWTFKKVGGGTWHIYKDGVECSYAYNNVADPSSISYDLIFGSGTGTYVTNSNLCDFRWWNRALTDPEILSVVRGKDVSSGLIGWWKLQELNGTNADDSSSSGFDGTINGHTSDLTFFSTDGPPLYSLSPSDTGSGVVLTPTILALLLKLDSGSASDSLSQVLNFFEIFDQYPDGEQYVIDEPEVLAGIPIYDFFSFQYLIDFRLSDYFDGEELDGRTPPISLGGQDWSAQTIPSFPDLTSLDLQPWGNQQPHAICYYGGYVYVCIEGGGFSAGGYVLKVNPSTMTVDANLHLPNSDFGQWIPECMLPFAGYIWMTNVIGDELVKINPSTLSYTIIHLGYHNSGYAGPSGIAYDGSIYVYTCNRGNGTISKVNASTATLVDTYTMPSGDLYWLEYTGGYLYCAKFTTGTIYKIDPSDGSVVGTLIIPGDWACGIIYDFGYLWCVSLGGGNLTKIDVSTMTIVDTIGVGPYLYGIVSDGISLWISVYESGVIVQFDPVSSKIVSVTGPAHNPQGICVGDNRIFSADAYELKLWRCSYPGVKENGGVTLLNGFGDGTGEPGAYIDKNSFISINSLASFRKVWKFKVWNQVGAPPYTSTRNADFRILDSEGNLLYSLLFAGYDTYYLYYKSGESVYSLLTGSLTAFTKTQVSEGTAYYIEVEIRETNSGVDIFISGVLIQSVSIYGEGFLGITSLNFNIFGLGYTDLQAITGFQLLNLTMEDEFNIFVEVPIQTSNTDSLTEVHVLASLEKTDSGSGDSQVLGISTQVSRGDSGVGSSSQTIKAFVSESDENSTEFIPEEILVLASLLEGDSGTGYISEPDILASILESDSGHGVVSVPVIFSNLSILDLGSGSVDINKIILKAIYTLGVGSDEASIFGFISVSELCSGHETPEILSFLSLIDSLIGDELVSINAHPVILDGGSELDSFVSILAEIPVDDLGTISDLIGIFSKFSVDDLGGVSQELINIFIRKRLTDLFHGSSTVSILGSSHVSDHDSSLSELISIFSEIPVADNHSLATDEVLFKVYEKFVGDHSISCLMREPVIVSLVPIFDSIISSASELISLGLSVELEDFSYIAQDFIDIFNSFSLGDSSLTTDELISMVGAYVKLVDDLGSFLSEDFLLSCEFSLDDLGNLSDAESILSSISIPDYNSSISELFDIFVSVIGEDSSTNFAEDIYILFGRLIFDYNVTTDDFIGIFSSVSLADFGADGDELTVSSSVGIQDALSIGVETLGLLCQMSLEDENISASDLILKAIPFLVYDEVGSSEAFDILQNVFSVLDDSLATDDLSIFAVLGDLQDLGYATSEIISSILVVGLLDDAEFSDSLLPVLANIYVSDAGIITEFLNIVCSLMVQDATLALDFVSILNSLVENDSSSAQDDLVNVFVRIAELDSALATDLLQRLSKIGILYLQSKIFFDVRIESAINDSIELKSFLNRFGRKISKVDDTD